MITNQRKAHASSSTPLCSASWRWRLLWIPIATALAACSSSSSTPNNSPTDDAGNGETKDGETGGTTADSGAVDAAPTPPPDGSSCMSLPAMQCQACCQQTFPGGNVTYELAQQDCVCGGSGTCSSVCSFEDCMTLTSYSTACTACIQGRMTNCSQQAASACGADLECSAYMACMNGC